MFEKMEKIIEKLNSTESYLLNEKKKLEVENLKGSTLIENKNINLEQIQDINEIIQNLQIMKNMSKAAIKTKDEQSSKIIYKNIKTMLIEISEILKSN